MKIILCFVAFSFTFSFARGAENSDVIKVGVARIPVISSKLTDPVPELAKRIVEVADERFDVKIFPFQRSVRSLELDEVDIHIPLIYSPAMDKLDLPYDFSSAALWQVNFVLYSHKDVTLDLENLAKYKIITDSAHVDLFATEVTPVYDIKGAVSMIDKKRVDGLIYADAVVDPIIRKSKLKNIRRTLYKVFDVKALIKKGTKKGRVDNVISRGIEVLEKSGELAELSSGWMHEYDDWQPFEIYQ